MKSLEIIKDYERQRPSYIVFSNRVEGLLKILLSSNSIQYHSIDNRCKTLDSFSRKVQSKKNYSDLLSVTDLAGVRIITNYAEDVDRIAKLVIGEFDIDIDNSIDKRLEIDSDKFGYISLHYVVSLKETRTALGEYAAFAGMKVEIQIRSILQHAWAEIEHDIGYKSAIEVPRPIRRKFSMLAGLLELADQEFDSLRIKLDEYKVEMGQKILEEPSEVRLDKVTYESFVKTNSLCIQLDEAHAEAANYVLIDLVNSEELLVGLNYFNIYTADDLYQALADNKSLLLKRLSDAISEVDTNESKFAQRGIVIWYLLQVLAAKMDDGDRIAEFVLWMNWPLSFAEYLVGFYRAYQDGEKLN